MYVASLLSQRLVINLLKNTAFDVKVDFYGGRKNGEPRDKPSESDWDLNQSQPMYESRIQTRQL